MRGRGGGLRGPESSSAASSHSWEGGEGGSEGGSEGGREGGREGREVYIAAESRFLLVSNCTMRCVYVTGQTHICFEQAALLGISRRYPCWSRSGRTWASTPGYGFLPPLNISHIVTPNDHCLNREN